MALSPQRSWGWGVLASLCLHGLGAAVLFSMPPLRADGPALDLAVTRVDAPLLLLAAPPPITPPDQPATKPPEPKPREPKVVEVAPPKAFEPPAVTLGTARSDVQTPNWHKTDQEGEHRAPESTVEQPALSKTRAAEPPPAPPPTPKGEAAPTRPPEPDGAPSAADQARPKPAPTPLSPAQAVPPAPDALPSPERVPPPAPPPPPAASAPVPPPAVVPIDQQRPLGEGEAKPDPTPGEAKQRREGEPSPPRREELPEAQRPEPKREEAPIDASAQPRPELRPGPERPGPAQSPTPDTTQPPEQPPEVVGPPDALFQSPPPTPEPAPALGLPGVTSPAAPSPGAPVAVPARPSGRGKALLDDAAWIADRESDASSVKRFATYRNGRVNAGEGLDIRTVRPDFPLLVRALALPQNPVVEVWFAKTGEVRELIFVRSSGYESDVDERIRNAVFNWRASGRALDDLPDVPGASVKLRITFLLR
jgi:hypothetical protein